VRAFVVEEQMLEAERAAAELVWKIAGAAVPVVVNPALQSPERMARAVKSALDRQQRERASAQQAERAALAERLASPLTGILLNCGLALGDETLPKSSRAKIARVQKLAEEMRAALDESKAR
jgi:hypothetical protein